MLLGPLKENSPLFDPSSNLVLTACELLQEELKDKGFLNFSNFGSISNASGSIFYFFWGEGVFSNFFSDFFSDNTSFFEDTFSGVPTDIFSAEPFFIAL